MTLVYIDTETTGLDPERHEVWELAYAIEAGPIKSGVLWHSLRHADPEALAMNGYWDRTKGVDPEACSTLEIDARNALDRATLVGANPAFDTAFLRARWGVTPWRYRLFDIETYAMPWLRVDEPIGLAAIAVRMNAAGHEIDPPQHDAHGDVRTLRQVHLMLRHLYAEESTK